MTTRIFLAALVVSLITLCFNNAARAADAPVYELRIYTTNEGKLPDLLKRFREHTCALFEKHGMTNIGYWVPIEKADGADNTLIYIISHKSRDAAKESWAAFQSDPDWKAAAKASEANGKILDLDDALEAEEELELTLQIPGGMRQKWKKKRMRRLRRKRRKMRQRAR